MSLVRLLVKDRKQNDPEKERKEEIKFNRLHTIYNIYIHHRKLDLKKNYTNYRYPYAKEAK